VNCGIATEVGYCWLASALSEDSSTVAVVAVHMQLSVSDSGSSTSAYQIAFDFKLRIGN